MSRINYVRTESMGEVADRIIEHVLSYWVKPKHEQQI